MPGFLDRNPAQNPNAITWKYKVDETLEHQPPADKREHNCPSMPHIMKRDDDNAERKMKQRVEETADFALAVEVDEESCPYPRLEYVRDASNKEADDCQYGYSVFHNLTIKLTPACVAS